MPLPTDLDGLAALFRKLGADDPEAWARSQVNEGIPQLARFVLLRSMWDATARDPSWIDRAINARPRRDDDPGSGLGPAVQRALAAGASRDDLHEIVRVMQWEALAGICLMLDGNVAHNPDLDGLHFGAFALDENDEPIDRVHGLVESLFETEPGVTEMRPKR